MASEIVAEMVAKVWKIAVSAGDQVAEGDVVQEGDILAVLA